MLNKQFTTFFLYGIILLGWCFMMEDSKKIMVQDENGVLNVGKVLSVFEMDNTNYAVYMIDVGVDDALVLAGKIVRDVDGNDVIVSIDDDHKNTIFSMIDNVIKRR